MNDDTTKITFYRSISNISLSGLYYRKTWDLGSSFSNETALAGCLRPI